MLFLDYSVADAQSGHAQPDLQSVWSPKFGRRIKKKHRIAKLVH